MPGIPERHRVVEGFRIVVSELECPSRAGVVCFVNPRGRTVANAQNIGGARINRIDIAKINRVGRHCQSLPGCAAVAGPQDRAARTARPRHPITHRAYPAQARGHTAGLNGPLRRSKEQDGYEE